MHHLLHHAQCADGFAAAVIAQRALLLEGIPTDQIRLQPVNYPDTLQMPPKNEINVDDHFYYLDYTPPQPALDWLKILASSLAFKSLTIIDHHSSAAPRHAGTPFFTSVFDLTKSGALLTFEHFNAPGTLIPDPIQLISWRDLGHAFQQPDHRFTAPAFNLHATLMRATPRTYEAWSPILFTRSTRPYLGRDLERGRTLRAFDSHILDAAAYNPLWLNFNGQRIPALTGLAPEIMSDALSRVLFYQENAPFAASWYVDPTTGLFTYSLRSRKNGPNVAEIAAAMAPGGGGHPCAAGFSTPIPIPFAE
jgi:hypothetical protein